MDLKEARAGIDRVDREMRSLFTERMAIAGQIAAIKAETDDDIYKPDREQAIIDRQTENMDPDLVREYTAFIRRLMEISRKYQYGRTMELRDCFPFSYETEETGQGKAAVTKDLMLTGGELPDRLYDILIDSDLYICRYRAEEDGAGSEWLITVTDHMLVLPDHNRLLIMFTCPGGYSGLGKILTMISDYGIAVTRLDTRPFTENGDCGCRFFAELAANTDTKETRAMLFQLSKETESMKVLGSYKCSHNREKE